MIFSTQALHPLITERLRALGPYRVASAPTPTAILAEGTDATILIVRANIPEAYFATAPALRAAVRHGAGLDMIPVEAATAAGVLVANVPGANAPTVAEHAIFAAIALRRQFLHLNDTLRRDGWTAARTLADKGLDLHGATLGILGMGNIGQALHRIGAAFGMTTIATTRHPENLPHGVRAVDLDALAALSDVLVLCCPLTSETRGALSHARIAMMRPGAVLINVARGPIVDTQALIAALRTRQILGAALDVFDHQPLPDNHPLYDLPNVILTPHMAGITDDSMRRMGSVVADEVARILDGALPLNLCNPEATAAYRRRFPV